MSYTTMMGAPTDADVRAYLAGEAWATPGEMTVAERTQGLPWETPIMTDLAGRHMIMAGQTDPWLGDGVVVTDLAGQGEAQAMREAELPRDWELWDAQIYEPAERPGREVLARLAEGGLLWGEPTMWALVIVWDAASGQPVGWAVVTRPVTAADLTHLASQMAHARVVCPTCRDELAQACWDVVTAATAPSARLCAWCEATPVGYATLCADC